MPFFTALTDKVSMRRATPKAKALMFAAGKTATAICSLAVAAFASLSQIPGGSWLLFATYWLVFCSIIMTAFTARGDYARALKTLRAGAQPSNG
jgi:hypothetical protein